MKAKTIKERLTTIEIDMAYIKKAVYVLIVIVLGDAGLSQIIG